MFEQRRELKIFVIDVLLDSPAVAGSLEEEIEKMSDPDSPAVEKFRMTIFLRFVCNLKFGTCFEFVIWNL